ncbi:hypothetical protein MCOR27_011089 [Pyricularia oryzae]|uniref:Peptidase M14 domain-containing protein n=2 Tax=Pyricularia TaxID=48558 RepID=A0ABQ8N5C1_PYRGI|nr:hypothetical protein MCOR01_001669 [Pyricularia oryzae]KAI6291550.1 hypothetical protein MCOR33_010535 [Pyricularia grisea]KAH9429765.1 hypothetical protein MCOR02_009502 [Pyricularia oryzae]KAI6263042.1 hypothetical protein MCOR19_000682 [Pyricularia oryzae]KAI6266269.1 hypothetical protein MCOR27_011089 [Pyricularia oryzae]
MKLFTISALASLTWACVLPEERIAGPSSRLGRRQIMGNTGIPVGTGDRFNDGKELPLGVGTQNKAVTSVLSVKEIDSGFRALASHYKFQTFEAPQKTYEGRSVYGGKVGGNGTCDDAYRVYLNGAIHARERGSADGVLFFVADLLYANEKNTGITYGRKSYSNADVKKALSAGLVFVPLSNPDGVAYDQASNSCWRKNRNPRSARAGDDSTIGVDLNRNFDFLWDFPKEFAPSVASSVASTDPGSEVFHGTSAFSEPETQNIKWVLDTYKKVRWFVDLHSYTGDVLYSWGSDTNQEKYDYMNFHNSSYNAVRGLVNDVPGRGRGYGEYTPAGEDSVNQGAAKRMGNAMSAANGRTYTVSQAVGLYPTSGSSDDYSYSRHFTDPSKNLVHGYTVEFGFGNNAVPDCPFYPSESQHNDNLREIGAGFMETLLAAVDLGLGDATKC